MGANREAVRQFVRETLGCECEESVFDSIESAQAQCDGGQEGLRLVIGDRLLVRTVGPIRAGEVGEQLGRWISAAVADRNAHRLHRVRIVLVTDDVLGVDRALDAALAELDLPDGRIHAHVVTPEAVHGLAD